MNVLPWHQAEFGRLLASKPRLPHALLFYGRPGIGKLAFARALAQALLCESPADTGGACGRCVACGWFDAASHPDFRTIEPESLAERTHEAQSEEKKASQQISVEQIRALSDFIHVSSHRGGPKVVLIHPAEALNPSSANALLKSLEEPPAGACFLLVAHRIHYLLPTIRSRCRQTALPGPDPAAAAAWLRDEAVPEAGLMLAQAGNAPLLARQLAAQDHRQQRNSFLKHVTARQFNPLQVAEQIGDYPVRDVVNWLQKWSFDLISQKFLGKVRYNPDYAEAAAAISAQIDALSMLRYHRRTVRLQRMVSHPLNPRLFLEQLLIEYADLLDAGRQLKLNGQKMLVDSHCHLNFPELASNLDGVMALMRENQVTHALCVSVSLEEFPQVRALAESHPHVYGSVGIHPDHENATEASVAELASLADHPKIIAVGETGLDYFRLKGDLEWQRERFRTHIRAARSCAKPLIIHTRKAAADTIRIMREEGAEQARGVMHCFTESWEVAQAAMDLGFYISFSGIVTFKNAQALKEVARKRLERMLIETDSPYLAPVPYRGKTNQPGLVKYVAEEIARLRNLPMAQVAAITSENFFNLFNVQKFESHVQD